MTLESADIGRFLRGEAVSEEVVQAIERGMDDPDSVVFWEAQRISEVARRLAEDDDPLRIGQVFRSRVNELMDTGD